MEKSNFAFFVQSVDRVLQYGVALLESETQQNDPDEETQFYYVQNRGTTKKVKGTQRSRTVADDSLRRHAV